MARASFFWPTPLGWLILAYIAICPSLPVADLLHPRRRADRAGAGRPVHQPHPGLRRADGRGSLLGEPFGWCGGRRGRAGLRRDRDRGSGEGGRRSELDRRGVRVDGRVRPGHDGRVGVFSCFGEVCDFLSAYPIPTHPSVMPGQSQGFALASNTRRRSEIAFDPSIHANSTRPVFAVADGRASHGHDRFSQDTTNLDDDSVGLRTPAP